MEHAALTIIIAFGALVAFLVVLRMQLKGRPREEAGAPKTKYSLDRATRRLAGGCSLVAGALAVFWLMQSWRGHVPKKVASIVDVMSILLALVAACFGLVGIRRELLEMSIKAAFLYLLMSVAYATALALESYIHGAPGLGGAGIVTFVVSVGLVFALARVVKRRRPVTAQPSFVGPRE